MSTSTITVDGNPVIIVPLPSWPAPKSIEPWISDSVAMVTSVFTGQVQTQAATGADLAGLMVTYAPLSEREARPLLAFLAQMRGMSRGFMMGAPEYAGPQGVVDGSSTPVAATSGSANTAGSTTLVTRGWKHSTYRLLEPWDVIQIGYRMHRVLDQVNSDGSGDASFEIFPSLREDVADGAAIVVANPKGLYRLAANKRNWSIDTDHYTNLSFPVVEYR